LALCVLPVLPLLGGVSYFIDYYYTIILYSIYIELFINRGYRGNGVNRVDFKGIFPLPLRYLSTPLVWEPLVWEPDLTEFTIAPSDMFLPAERAQDMPEPE